MYFFRWNIFQIGTITGNDTGYNKQCSNKMWGMFANSHFIESFKSNEVCGLLTYTLNFIYSQNKEFIVVKSGNNGGHG